MTFLGKYDILNERSDIMKKKDSYEEFLDLYGTPIYCITGILIAVSLILSVRFGGVALWCITASLVLVALAEGLFRSLVYELALTRQFILAMVLLVFCTIVWIF